MCRSGEDGGRRCADHRRHRSRTIADLRPNSAQDRPDVDWATDPSCTPDALYEHYPAKVAGAVIDVMTTAKRCESEMTSDLLALLPAGTRAHGLEFRMKSPASLARKINDRRRKKPTREPAQIAAQITDVVRYTAISRPDQLVDTARTVADGLTARGWTVIEAEQSYLDGNRYKGLHMLARHSGGTVAEFQFHSDESQQVKDVSHLHYEAVRDPRRTDEERAARNAKMTALWAQVPTPPGITALTDLGGCPVTPKSYR